MGQKYRVAALIVLMLIATIASLVLCQPWKLRDEFRAAVGDGPMTYTLYWDKQAHLVYECQPPAWELILREEVRQDGQVVLSHLTETGIGELSYGPGTPAPTPAGSYVTITGYDFDISGLSGRIELWACMHWEAEGEDSLFVEFADLTPDGRGFYPIGHADRPYVLYFPIAAKGEQ